MLYKGKRTDPDKALGRKTAMRSSTILELAIRLREIELPTPGWSP
jgi:hypothetical protein